MHVKDSVAPPPFEVGMAVRSSSLREIQVPELNTRSSTPQSLTPPPDEKDTPQSRLQRKQNEVFDLDLVKRKIRPKSAASLMTERKTRARGKRAFLMVVLFPWHTEWWAKKVPSTRQWIRQATILYALHVFSILRVFFARPKSAPLDFLELSMPLILLVILGALVGQAAIAHASEAPRRPGIKRDSSSERKLPLALLSGGGASGGPGESAPSTPRYNHSGDSETSDETSESDEDSRSQAALPVVFVRRASLLGVPPQPLGASGATMQGGALRISPRAMAGALHKPFAPQAADQAASGASPPVPAAAAKTKSAGRRAGRFSGWTRPRPPPTANAAAAAAAAAAASNGNSRARHPHDMQDTDSVASGDVGGLPHVDEEEEDGLSESDVEQDDSSAAGSASRDRPPRKRTMSQEDVLESVRSVHWSADGPEKVTLTPAQIRAEIEKKIDLSRPNAFYAHMAMLGAALVAAMPVMFRAWSVLPLVSCAAAATFKPLYGIFDLDFPAKCDAELGDGASLGRAVAAFLGRTAGTELYNVLAVVSSALASFGLSLILLNAVVGAVDTYKRRYLYAKYFAMLTSSRRARRADLPHFRLHRVDHIRVWLALRSRRLDVDRYSLGPYRASDTTAHAIVMIGIFLVGAVAVRALQRVSQQDASGEVSHPLNPSSLGDGMLMVWAALLSMYVQRVMSLASKTHEKFSNTSVLLTEELNIHMRLLKKPHKREELTACNQMLKVANSLIKELEGSKTKKGSGGLVLDPALYSLIRVTLLSALGALSSDLLGFRVRLWKLG